MGVPVEFDTPLGSGLLLDVALVPTEARTDRSVLIVIDQIRASTTLVTMLERGCTQITVAGSVRAARAIARDHGGLLAGEYKAVKPRGFDLDNSPSDLDRLDLTGRSIVFTTTNGTAVLARVRASRQVLVGCLRNATACAAAALDAALATGEPSPSIQVVCAGTRGRFVIDDAYAAGVIAEAILREAARRDVPTARTDATDAVRRLAASFPDALAGMEASTGGRTLETIGKRDDLEFCAVVDASRVVPRLLPGEPMRISA